MFNRRRKGLIIIILVAISLLANLGVLNVFAAADGNGSDYPAGYFNLCGGYNCMWAGRSGIRIALVDENGNKVSGTNHIDLWVMSKMGNIVNYDLYSNKGIIHNFDSAFYGNKIKQEIVGKTTTLEVGKYFDLPNVYDMKDVIGAGFDFEKLYTKGFKTPYGNWHPEWIQSVVDLVIDNTSDTNTDIVDRILAKMNYSGSAVDAANSNYYLQYEPLVAHGRIGKDIKNYIFIGTVTEYYKYDKAKAGKLTPWFSGGSTSIYISGDDMPSNFTNGTGKAVSKLLSKNGSKIYGEGVAHIWIKDLIKTSYSCSAAINYINSHYTPNTPEYHEAVEKLRDGNFDYTDDLGVFKKQEKKYNYYYLKKSVYTKLSSGQAACKNKGVCDHFSAEVNIDDCSTGKTFFGDINDQDAWLTCEIAYEKNGTIYSSDNTGHKAVETDHGGIVGNSEYCEIFCYESLETRFPTSVTGVKAGQTFSWGDASGVFGSIKVQKICSTKNYIAGSQGYRFHEWSSDYESNEKALIKNYMTKAAYEKAKSNITTTSESTYIACTGCPYICGSGTSTYECDKRYRGIATVSEQTESYSDGYVGVIEGKSPALSVTTGYIYNTAASAKAAAKAELELKIQNNIDKEYAEYTGGLLEESTLLDKIGQCTNNLAYESNLNVKLIFEEPTNPAYGSNSRNFFYKGDLTVIKDYNKNNVDTSKCTKKTVYSYVCSGIKSSASCTSTSKKVWDCTNVEWNLEGTFTYTYPSEKFTWFSLKSDGTLLNLESKNKKSESEAFFYSIGYGLPTAFSLTNGKYDLKVIVTNLGDQSATTGAQNYNVANGHFAPLATSLGSEYGFEYTCTYEVENEMFGYECKYDSNGKLTSDSPRYCDTKEDNTSSGSLLGLDITFRQVTLLEDGDSVNKAFPGKDGSGRNPKGNWSMNEVEIKKILDADIYKNDMAMYEIMLDVNAIQQIRKDNEKYFAVDKDPYTSYYDYNNAQKVYCVTDASDQKYCASTFISKLYSGSGLNYRLLGTCLPTSNTLNRAEYVLENGCDVAYTYPTINWLR